MRRELFGDASDRLARAALLVVPGAEYYAVSQGGRQIGFASSTIDTSATGIQVTDYLRADLQADGAGRPATARTVAMLSRSLKLRQFHFELGPALGGLRVTGTIDGDSLLTLVAGGASPDTQRLRLERPMLLPTVVPMVLALAESPDVGQSYTFAVFDPVALRPRDMTVRVAAESLFVVVDSAALDSRAGRFAPAHQDTVRAWRIEQTDGGPLSGWIDQKGRLVEATRYGKLALRRTAFEIAYENWVSTARRQPRAHNASRNQSGPAAIGVTP